MANEANNHELIPLYRAGLQFLFNFANKFDIDDSECLAIVGQSNILSLDELREAIDSNDDQLVDESVLERLSLLASIAANSERLVGYEKLNEFISAPQKFSQQKAILAIIRTGDLIEMRKVNNYLISQISPIFETVNP